MHQGIHAARVEQPPPLGTKVRQRGVDVPGFLVGPGGNQGVEDVGNRDDPGFQWDFLPDQPIRVAGTVEPLV